MLHESRILVATDDSELARRLAERLRQAFPDSIVISSGDPAAYGFDFDVFVIDCRARGTDELRLLRAEAPDALFLGFVDDLDRDSLKAFVNAGVEGLFDAALARDHDELVGRIRSVLTRDSTNQDTSGLLGVMRSMADLVRQWNRRLDRLEVS